ncbi:hypothetical protein PV371_20965 [Streptomyces sp. TX20-6-3]|uniref:hypothetical protein n=1 Tax=Streptomyces sp. TX20-6-3 TaxID=3028705 RepID=UPI0029BC8984|nr:hypothetical protein [Streptomyces sp. TX20-6-3]MDX2562117.1 hypothetical protein [Streptomyces sp. TX20-6-3]
MTLITRRRADPAGRHRPAPRPHDGGPARTPTPTTADRPEPFGPTTADRPELLRLVLASAGESLRSALTPHLDVRAAAHRRGTLVVLGRPAEETLTSAEVTPGRPTGPWTRW